MPFPKELAAPVYPKGAAPVGTPVKVFEPYKAHAFTAPAVPVGGIVTTVTLQSTSAADQTNVPFTFGQVFKRGDLGPDCALVGSIQGKPDLPLQVNVKATHDDGSVRHAIISGVLPSLPANSMPLMALKRAATAANGLNVPMPKALPWAKLTIAGVPYTAAPKVTDSAAIWFGGPVASDYVLNVPFVDASGNQHPTLTAQFSVRAYSNNAVRVDVAIEHCKAYTSTADITYSVTLYDGSGAVFSLGSVVHTPCARWKKTYWYGIGPSLHIRHDTKYLIASKAVPNYDQTIKIGETTLSGYATQLASGKFAPMGFGTFQPAMGTTGGRPDIGIMPDTYVAALLSMDKRAKDIVLASADAAGSWPAHRRDDSAGPGKGMPLSVINFPYASIYANVSDCTNPATGKNEFLPKLTTVSQGSFDSAHQPGLYYLPYLLTGDYFYLEGLHFWCNWNAYNSNPGYRGQHQGLVSSDQVRGQGWSLRTLGEAAYITPDDHPAKQTYIYWAEANLAYYNARYTDGTDNQLGVITQAAIVYNNGLGIAPWQDDFFTQGLNHLAELLGFDSAKRLLRWKAKFQVDRLLAPGTCIQNAASYALNIRAAATSPYCATMGDCMDGTIPAAQKAFACNSPERLAMMGSKCLPGDLDGYPGSTEGYPANYQPALAAAVDSGHPDAPKAWAMFAKRPTQPDYSTGAQFAIVPRLAVDAPPVVAPVPTPTPTPTPAPAPAPTPAPVPTVRYQEVKAAEVMAFFAKSFSPPTGETVSGTDWFFDAAKGIVVFKVTTTKA